MIIDQIKNWANYPFGNAWSKAFNFLQTVHPVTDDKKYHIDNEDIFAIVSSYQTRSYKDAVLETHRKYIDIQTVISGCESFEWSPKDVLSVKTPYNDLKDVEFYDTKLPRTGKIELHPGIFIMLLPQDAHMPSLIFNDKIESVKKVVIKLKVDLLK